MKTYGCDHSEGTSSAYFHVELFIFKYFEKMDKWNLGFFDLEF